MCGNGFFYWCRFVLWGNEIATAAAAPLVENCAEPRRWLLWFYEDDTLTSDIRPIWKPMIFVWLINSHLYRVSLSLPKEKGEGDFSKDAARIVVDFGLWLAYYNKLSICMSGSLPRLPDWPVIHSVSPNGTTRLRTKWRYRERENRAFPWVQYLN